MALDFPKCKAEEPTAATEWGPGAPGSGGQQVFTVLREAVLDVRWFIPKKWFRGSEAVSSKGVKAPRI